MEPWRDYVTGLANTGKPATAEQIASLIQDWERYFRMVGITDPDEQGKELRDLLRARIAATGNISILAPEKVSEGDVRED